MPVELLITYLQCFLEAIAIVFILSTINIKARLGFVKTVAYAAILSLIFTFLDVIQMPYHLVFTIVANIAIYLLIKRPSRISVTNYVIDILLSIVILTLVQMLITSVASLFSINLMGNEMILIVILICIILLFVFLSASTQIHVFFEKYYLKNRMAIFFSIITLLFLITIIIDLLLYHENVFSSGGNTQIFLLIIGYFAVNLLLGISLFRMKRATEQSNLVIEYGEHVEKNINEYRKLVHDYKNHLQMVASLNMNSDGLPMNNDLHEYIRELIDRKNRSENVSIIRDNVLISAMLYQKQELAKQKNIDFTVNIIGSLSQYAIPKTELIDILINLIDNAIEEVEKLDPEDRIIHLDFYNNYLEVRNRVSLMISESRREDVSRFFEHGYSTKAGNNRGFGLSNVLSIAERYGVSVKTKWVDKYIVFRLSFSEREV
jgi:Signal transduction histidine kinase regulating citrate/malate metabolism